MSAEDAQLIQEFVAEASEHLAGVEQHLLAYENDSLDADPQRIHEVFRAIHTVKGVSAMLGFDAINRLSHHMENVLNQLRHTSGAPSGATVEVLLRSADKLRHLVENIDSSANADLEPELTELTRLFEQIAPAEAAAAVGLDHLQQLVNNLDGHTTSPAALPAQSDTSPAAADRKDQSAAASAAEQERGGVPARANQGPNDVNVRVPVAVLERLMNLAGELVLSRNQLLRVVATRRKAGIETISSRLDQVTTELQEAIMCSRMQQVATVFNRFPRLVRDLSKKLHKQCQLIIEGSEVELDKTILEGVVDPLTHLLRNSLDHGIELPAQRIAKGKNPVGSLKLSAFHQAGKVHIVLNDDGAGIHRTRVIERAVSRGLVTAAQAAAMTDRDVVALLFAPGFSTAEVVTDVSGRGVGMDVVKTNIEKLGGTVEIQSTPGQGMEVRVSLPLTLAIIPSLIVCDSGVRLALPEASIIELVRVTGDDQSTRVERLQNEEVLRLRGSLLPLVRLGPLMHRPPSPPAKQPKRPTTTTTGTKARPEPTAAKSPGSTLPPPANVIIVESGATKFALAVDQVRDPEQIVVKPLGRHLRDCRFLAGTTVLGDGNIAFILDVAGLAATASLAAANEAAGAAPGGKDSALAQETQTTLLFRNGNNELLGVPMAMISRIERIHGRQIQQIDGRMLMTYRGACLPLLSLNGDLATELRSREDCYVLVFAIDDAEVALVVPHLVDIRDVSLNVEADLFGDTAIMGTVLIDGEIARLLDLVELVAKSSASTARKGNRRTDASVAKTVLLAEDSKFIRGQVKRFLESDEYRVVAFEDAAKAWSALERERVTPDIVVTDIEMPNMDGYEFCRRIRASQRWQDLPVIALTSLCGEEDKRRGREVGFNDYQVKMDRDRLSSSVHQLLAAVSP